MNDCIGSAVTVINAYIGNKISNLFGGCYEIEYKKEQYYFDNEIIRNMIESRSNLK